MVLLSLIVADVSSGGEVHIEVWNAAKQHAWTLNGKIDGRLAFVRR
jgi:hypothetical protein